MQRLATGEWFTSRVSSCGAFISAYPQAPEGLRSDLRALFAHLCRDDTPMVRRAAAQNLASFARIVEPDLVPSEFLPLFQYLTQDGERAGAMLHAVMWPTAKRFAVQAHGFNSVLWRCICLQIRTRCVCWQWSAAAPLHSSAGRTTS